MKILLVAKLTILLTPMLIGASAFGQTVDWSNIINEPTTLGGYGITDANELSNMNPGTTTSPSNFTFWSDVTEGTPSLIIRGELPAAQTMSSAKFTFKTDTYDWGVDAFALVSNDNPVGIFASDADLTAQIAFGFLDGGVITTNSQDFCDTGSGPYMNLGSDNTRNYLLGYGDFLIHSAGTIILDQGSETESIVLGGYEGVLQWEQGTPFQAVLSATGSVNFASTANDATNSQTITVTGVSTTDTPSVHIGGAMPSGWDLVQAYVSATDTVTVVGRNKTGSTNDPGAVTMRATVIQF